MLTSVEIPEKGFMSLSDNDYVLKVEKNIYVEVSRTRLE
jgi:hypothetical protein